MSDESRQKLLRILTVLGIAAVGGAFFWLGTELKLQGAGPELKLPLVVIGGVVVLLVTLALVAVTFALLDLDDKSQALALPEGSIRAVIALMLLVVFAIVAIYLYGSIANSGKVQFIDGVPAANEADVRKQITVVAVAPSKEGTIKVYYKDIGGAGDDLAKQLIVLLGTLVTAVASFYFGSSSVSSAQAAADRARISTGGPNATAVDQATLKAGGNSQQLKITGTNLAKVKTVKLLSSDGKTTVLADAGSVKASETDVSCTVTMPASAPTGAWDVVVSDNANNDSTVPKAVTIEQAAAPPAAPDAKAPKAPELKANGNLQDLTVEAPDAPTTVKSLKLTLDNVTLPAQEGTARKTDTGVACKITVPTTAKQDEWAVIVTAADDKETTLKDSKVKIGPA